MQTKQQCAHAGLPFLYSWNLVQRAHNFFVIWMYTRQGAHGTCPSGDWILAPRILIMKTVRQGHIYSSDHHIRELRVVSIFKRSACALQGNQVPFVSCSLSNRLYQQKPHLKQVFKLKQLCEATWPTEAAIPARLDANLIPDDANVKKTEKHWRTPKGSLRILMAPLPHACIRQLGAQASDSPQGLQAQTLGYNTPSKTHH